MVYSIILLFVAIAVLGIAIWLLKRGNYDQHGGFGKK